MSIKIEQPTGIVDGINKQFEVDHVPIYITVNGRDYYPGDGYTTSRIIITMNDSPDADSTIKSIYE